MALNVDWDLILKYLNGECSEEELRHIEHWRNQSAYNRQFLSEVEQIWNVQSEEASDIDADEAWAQFSEKTFGKTEEIEPAPQKVEKKSDKPGYAGYLYRIAAVLLIGAMLAWGYQWINQRSPVEEGAASTVVMQTVSTNPGEKAGVTFSDGTEIIMNSASEVRFPQKFNDKQRLVHLEGEAYFKVAPNKNLPFIVETDKARIKVLGTKFNVRSWKDDESAEVAVREGTVQVQATDTSMIDKSVILKRGQRSLVDKVSKQIKVENADVEKNLLWIGGGMYFNNDSFQNVLKNLERRYNVSFKVMDKNLLSVPYTGEFHKANLNEVLKVLSVSMEVEFEKTDNYIFVQRDGN